MQKYTYETVQIPPNIQMGKAEKGNEAAIYLKNVLNAKAIEGWKFQSVETVGVAVKPGCLESLRGIKETFCSYYVIVFRREVD